MNVSSKRQLQLAVIYDGIRIETGLRFDLLVEDRVVGELKAKEAITPVDEAQILTYLKLTNSRRGFLIKFNVTLLKNGIKRIVNLVSSVVFVVPSWLINHHEVRHHYSRRCG
jgi:GxxExxY protein